MLHFTEGTLYKPVLYLDLDGTVRHGFDELGRFVNHPRDVKIFDGVAELLLAYVQLGWRIVACTNQGGVSLGHFTLAEAWETLEETNRRCFRVFDQLVMCPHHPDAKNPNWRNCWCRKPKPGMVVEAATAMAARHKEVYPPHLALFVGDRNEDAACAVAAGVRFMEAKKWRERTHLHELHEQKATGFPQ